MTRRFHYYKQRRTVHDAREPFIRLHWLNGAEWRGVLLVINRHELGFRFTKD